MRFWKPIFIEDSKVPAFLSKFAPIRISAINIGKWVWCRGKISDRLRRHETIHYQQQLETLFLGFAILYILFFLVNLLIYRDAKKAYSEIAFEREAFSNEWNPVFLSNRRRYNWLWYLTGK